MQNDNNNKPGDIFNIDENTSNTVVLRQERDTFYKDKGVDFVKSYYAEDGVNEWKDPTTSRKVFFEILNNIKYTGNEVFMDCGCGLGHVVFLASHVFQKVIGIELLETVFNECEKNIKLLFPNGYSNIDLIQGDMLIIDDHTIDNVNVFYFSCPFNDLNKFRQWIDKITLSFLRKKRKIYFIYYYPLFESEMANSIFTLNATINTIGKVNIYSVPHEEK